MDSGLPLTLVTQLDCDDPARSRRAVEEIRASIESGELELGLPFLSMLLEQAARVERPTWSLRLLTEAIWFADDTIGFLYPETYWSSPGGEHGFIMSALRQLVGRHSAYITTRDYEWMNTYAYASGLLSGDRSSLLELGALRHVECPAVRDTAAVSRALRAHLGDAQPYAVPELRMASVLEGGLALREISDDVLLSYYLPYEALHGGGPLGRALVWFRCVVAIAYMADPACYEQMIARIAEVAPPEVQRSARDLALRSR